MAVAQPVIPKFASELLRLRTFIYYRGGTISVRKLAICGFYCVNNYQNLLECYSCGVNIREIEGDVLTFHVKISPHCFHIKEICSKRQYRNLLKRVDYVSPVTYFIRQKAPFNINFVDCALRFDSLINYKSVFSKRRIARAGFYLQKVLICFSCGVNILQLTKDPWITHCISYQCSFLVSSRGQSFIDINREQLAD